MRALSEKWDVYSVDRIKLAKTVTSDNELLDDEYRIVVGVCIFNSSNQLLIQQRQSSKKNWANMWDITASGSVISGETSSEAATRELKEELDIAISFDNKLPQLSISFTKGFEDYYFIEADIKLDTITYQKEEVKNARWASLEEVNEMMDQGLFIPYHKHLIALCFEMKTVYGSYKYEG